MIGELVFLQVGEEDSGEGGKERGTFVDGSVVDGLPDLQLVSGASAAYAYLSLLSAQPSRAQRCDRGS